MNWHVPCDEVSNMILQPISEIVDRLSGLHRPNVDSVTLVFYHFFSFISLFLFIEPIASKHFEKDPEFDLLVLANVHRVARRAKHLSVPKNPLDMEFDMGNLIFIVYSEKN